MQKLVGRHKETDRLKTLLKSQKSELLVIYGRRRIGKTFLIRSIYEKQIYFEFSGIHHASLSDQLENFHYSFSGQLSPNVVTPAPRSWIAAFKKLENQLDTERSKKKKVIFIDEFPWLATRRSKFLAAFEHFWNTYASRRSDLIVVICGSSASYMVEKVILNKGGLHNRITEKIRLLPFNLNETALFLAQKGIKYGTLDILQLYMSLGGVPHYLEQLKKGESVAQAIDRLCFSKDGFLIKEFDNVFASLFENDHFHKDIVMTLSKAKRGFTRNEIIQASNHFKSGGTLTKVLNELIESGFVDQYLPHQGNVKKSLFRLSDEYSRFYMKFIHNKKHGGEGTWLGYFTKPSYKSWCGFAFETLCLKHIIQIKKALGISQVYTEEGSWVSKSSGDKPGVQIDLVIDRGDNIINICEMKFYREPFTITKSYATELRNKISQFRSTSKKRKNIFLVMITTYGITENAYALELVQNSINAKALFQPD